MLKQGYIELNKFIKKHYGIESSYTVRNKRDSIIKLIKRNDKEHLLSYLNTDVVVEEQKLFDFLQEREDYIEKHGGKLTWRLKIWKKN